MPLDYLFVGSWKNFLLTRFHICLMVKNATTWIYSKKCTCLFLLSFKFPKDPKVWQHFCIGSVFHLKMVHAVELLKVCRLGGIKSTIGYSRVAWTEPIRALQPKGTQWFPRIGLFVVQAISQCDEVKTWWAFYRDLDWWPGSQKGKFRKITGSP